MDSAGTRGRMFPAYTTDQLKTAVADYQLGTHPCGTPSSDHFKALVEEIARREAGLSAHCKVPQIT